MSNTLLTAPSSPARLELVPKLHACTIPVQPPQRVGPPAVLCTVRLPFDLGGETKPPQLSECPRRETPVADIEIGIGKSGRRAYGFDDIAIVPSRRTRDPEDVDISWQIDAYGFELPVLGAAMDGVMSPRTAVDFIDPGSEP